MTTPALSLWEAYQLETLRSKGLTDETLLTALKEKDLKILTDTDDSYDYKELIEAAEDNEDSFQEAVQSGYRVKFLSIYGIKNLLKLKYNLESDNDYTMSDNHFEGLLLTREQISEFQTLASSQWQVLEETDENGRRTVSIQHKINQG